MPLPASDLGEVVCYRASSYRYPLWSKPNREAGRFHRLGLSAQYLCLHPLGPMAEMLRSFERAESALGRPYRVTEADVGRVRHRVWALRVALPFTFVLDFDTAGEVGLEVGDLVDDHHAACQDAGSRLGFAEAEPTAWIYPSAALPGTRNVVIFGPRYLRPYDASPTPAAVPGASIADQASAIKETIALMRHMGDPHPGLEAFRRGLPIPALAQPVSFAD